MRGLLTCLGFPIPVKNCYDLQIAKLKGKINSRNLFRISNASLCLSAKNRLLTDDPNYIKKKRTKVDPNAPDNEQDQEMNQALVLEVEPALVAEVNEDTSGEQYADECGIPIGSQEFKLMDGSTLF